MAQYTYLAADLRTNAILAELPLSGVSFSSMLNGAGEFEATLALKDSRVRKIDPIGATETGRTALYVDRDGVLVWGGILWTRQSPSGQNLELGGMEFWSYFRRRFITDATFYTGTDQLAIARGLINTAQAKLGGNIGVAVGTETSGVLRDFSAYSYELRNVAEAVEQLAELDNGFDFAIDVAYDTSGVPTKTLRLGYPFRGRTSANTGLVWEYPGNVMDYSWNEDSTEQATVLYVQGEGEADSMASSMISAPEVIDAGYPLLELQVSRKNTSNPLTLADQARAEIAARKATVTVPKVTVRADAEPVLGAYIVGDEMRLRVDESPRFPNGTDTIQRITQISVTPNDADTAESVDLTLQAV